MFVPHLSRGTLLVAMYGGFKQIGRTGLLAIPAAINQALTAILVDRKRVEPRFLQLWLNHRVKNWERLAGSSRRDPNITKSDIAAFPVLLPSLQEQQSISKVIDCWEVMADTVQQLITSKLLYKQGLVQLLLFGKLRFREFAKEPWQEVRLADVTVGSYQRNGSRLGVDAVMAVTKADGMVPMKEETIGASLERYKVVRRDWFAYNPMRVNIGSIARWTGKADVLVSPDYVVFRCKTEAHAGLFDRQKDGPSPPLLDPDFLDHLRRSRAWEQFVTASGNGSVRVRIYFDDLGQMRLRLPPFDEQQRIAAVLNTFDREIDLFRSELGALKQQKKGLMQKLLTGEIRVKVRP